ncbi:hypothetical protein HPB48_021021 [Haemaphysalis longicornis]|uniref:Transposase n=1 Tax=Haemaphysalis longicornis TaxID=44386 RepID=A0A9J6GIX7_HAELO|nr:hypothetical protein HPB48_021021 [Haemaphysalis longicornis]
MDGFIDYGGNCCGKKPADHALVMMFVPLFDNWVQPIARFASKGAAPGDVLAHLVTEAVMELAKHNASLIAVVSYGAGSNKSMWARLCISGRLTAAVHKVQHPCIPGEHLHFLCDVPHMVKCIRNHMQRYNHAQAGDCDIVYDHYRTLYTEDEKKQLRVVPKLTLAHIEPDSLRKMNVRLATQLFSRGTALGLEVYRKQGLPGLEASEGTEVFTRRLNDLFDALNAKFPKEAVRPGSPKQEIIDTFLRIVDNTAERFCRSRETMFASLQTIQSLRLSLLSTKDILALLFKEGVSYVLTVKLNQDPLERFFGNVRSFGGHEEHPKIVNFAYIFRLLTLYTPVRWP